MSISVMADVWANSKSKGSSLLVLLAIADHAQDKTRDAWPSVEYLAKKSRLSVRSVQYIIRQLEKLGELVVVKRAGYNNVNIYIVGCKECMVQIDDQVVQPVVSSGAMGCI